MSDSQKPSHVEIVKEQSNYLRGTIKQTLESDVTHFSADEGALLKSHGTYQQDDRDIRQKLVQEKKEPAYSMMVRTKFPGGTVTPELYLTCDDLSNEYANHTLRITNRQNFQFHGVLKKDLKTVIRAINEKLGTTLGGCGDNVRNVMYCPAPLADRREINLMPYVRAVSDQFLPKAGAYYEIWLNGEKMNADLPKPGQDPEPIYGKTYLPRKFKIGMAFPGDNCVDVYTHDLGIVPEIMQGKLKGFNILVGGGFGTTHGIATTYPRLATPFCFVQPEDLTEISKAIVLVQRDFGNRADRKKARMKYLIDSRGIDWFRAEVEKRFGKKTEPVHSIQWMHVDEHLGWHPEGNGRWFLGISVENGRVADRGKLRLKSGLRAVVERFRPEIFLTPCQDILLCGFNENQKKELEDLLASFGIAMPETLSNLRKSSMACPALPTCGLAISESERALPSVIDDLEKEAGAFGLTQQKMIIRMTGCPNGCARPYNAEIAFVGRTVGTYNLYVGGSLTGDRLNFLVAEKVAQNQLAKTIRPLFKLFQTERRKDEGFGDYCDRLGQDKIKSILSSN